MAPLGSHVLHKSLINAVAIHQTECLEAGIQFAGKLKDDALSEESLAASLAGVPTI